MRHKLALAIAALGILAVCGAVVMFASGWFSVLGDREDSSEFQLAAAGDEAAIARPTAAPVAADDAAGATEAAADDAAAVPDAAGTPEAAAVDEPATDPRLLGADTDPAAVQFPDSLVGDELANARSWIQTQVITAQCMREQGFEYTFMPWWAREKGDPMVSWSQALPADRRQAGELALYGDTGAGADYSWDDAGCWGYAVHVMGNDNNH
jgi:hypothetical protein